MAYSDKGTELSANRAGYSADVYRMQA